MLFLILSQAEAQIAPANNPHGQIKTACGDCHTTKGWSPLRRDLKFKHEETGFALEGQHALIECKKCHASLKFTETPTACKACHKDAHDGKLGDGCGRCHAPRAWQDFSKIIFVHQVSRFPLLGRHQHAGCDNCHNPEGENKFMNLPLACGVCHQKDYEATTNPDHRLAGFPRRCEICHSSAITGWEFDAFGDVGGFHSRTRFPLTGAHLAVACNQCHVNNRFAGTPSDCFACHQADYQRAANPNHAALNFSRNCTDCHNTNAWVPSTFEHDAQFFPINSGRHEGEWQTCADCHVNPADFKVFECIFCHAHQQAEMDDEHEEVSNYQYNSRACYSCHPQGEE